MGPDDAATRSSLRQRIVNARGRDSTLRSVLFFGFSAVFALWLVSAYDLVQRVTNAERQAAAITTRFIEGEELLFTVRAQVLLSSVYARDAVLDTRSDAASLYRQQLQAMRSDVERALQQYLPNVDSSIEREHWSRLGTELEDL